MKLDHCDNAVLTVEEAVQLCLCGGDLQGVFVNHADTVAQFNQQAHRLQQLAPVLHSSDPGVTAAQWHQELSSQWMMPERYQQLDIGQHLLDLTHTDAQAQRVHQELEIYAKHGLLDLLRYLVYMVDTMLEHGVVWGVGRGSSVASYVLYLIGINSIDPMQHGLEITEFLK